MKKHWKSAVALVSSLVIICAVVALFILENPLRIKKMEEKTVPAETSESVAKKLNVMDEDFVILEIVPDISYSKLGFLQIGSEPVNMMEACKDGYAENIQKIAGDTSAMKLVSTIDGNAYEKLQSDYQLTDEEMSQYWTLVSSGSAIKSKQKYQFADGKKYAMNQDSLRSTLPASEVSVNDDIFVVTLTAAEINSIASGDLNAFLDKVDLFYVSQSYVTEEQKSLITNYGVEKASVSTDTVTFFNQGYDLSWDVVRSIFSFVGKKSEPTPIVLDKSLYAALEDSNSAKNVTTTQYSLNRTVKYSTNMNSEIIVDNTSSMKDTTLFLREKDMPAGENKPASSNHAFKLYLMCAFRDPAEFYNLFIESKVVTETGENQIQSGDARSYWNTYSFLPAKKEMKASDHSKGDADYWKNEMKIALSGEEVSTVNYCVISSNTSEAFQSLGEALKTAFGYEPMSAYVDGEKRSYEVLEIEAASSISDNKLKGFSDTMEARIEELLPYTGYSTKDTLYINVTQMTTSQFVSKKNSLTSDYDLIYIGGNTSGLRTTKDASGNAVTDYGSTESNKKLRGIIYSHIGPFVNFDGSETSKVAHDTPNGVLLFSNTGGGSLRYSGTDITTLRKEELNKYVIAGLPVVVSSTLLEDVKAGASNYTKHNNDTYTNSKYFSDVDENNMYQFIKEQKEKVVTSDYNYRTDSLEFLERLVYEKPSMKLNYITTSAGQKEESGFDKNKTYTFSKSSRTRQFTLNVSVSSGSEGIRDFTGNLYVDKNADGVYAESERVAFKKFKPNGNSTNLTFNLNPNYHGAFTWRLVVYPTGLKELACAQTGYGNIKFSDSTEKEDVYVLQVQAMPGTTEQLMPGESTDITQTYDKEYDKGFTFNKYHGTVWGCKEARTINIATDFGDYLKLADYNLHVTVINLKQFCSSAGWTDGTTYTKNTFGSHYDMLVFGFADSYRDMEMTEDAAKAIQDFIDSKKSVLFTHDLTSPSDLSDKYKWDVYISKNRKQANGAKQSRSVLGETNPFVASHYYFVEMTNGKGFNQYLRDAMGLNRYKQNKKVSSKYSSDYYTSHSNLLRNDEQFYGYTYTALMQYSNYRRISSNNTNNTANTKGLWGPYKGLVANLVDEKTTPDDGAFYDVISDSIMNKADGDGIPYIYNGYATQYVTNVNEGQITKYPYDLSEAATISANNSTTGLKKYQVAETHGQAFQLNVEDPDVICWFALADSENTSTNWYDTSPNDASNNYYIYNKGNVTYTGVGHRGGLTEFEKKLFVNTFVASLKAGVAGPQPEVTNGYAVSLDNGDYQVVYADVDSDSTDSEFNKDEDVDFYVTDDSTDSKYVYVSLEVESKDADAVDGYKEVKQGDGISIVSKNGGEISGPVTMTDSGGKQHYVWKIRKTDLSDTGTYEYTIKYPRAGLKTESLLKFRLYAYSDNSGNLGIQGVQNGAVMRRAHFRLD